MIALLRIIAWLVVLSSMQYDLFAQTDLVINEIMVNPNNGQLPPFEYIELFNNGPEVSNLAEYTLIIGKSSVELPAYRLSPQQFVLLCSTTALPYFESFGNALPLNRWPALNNKGATISLVKGDRIMDKVMYTDSWYPNSLKKNGGWSLERINPNISCNIDANWSASTHELGGTPCRPNAIRDLYHIPLIQIDYAKIEDTKLVLSFNIAIENINLNLDNFEVVPHLGTPAKLDVSPYKDSLYLYFDGPFQKNTLYHLKCKNLKWCTQPIVLEEVNLFRQGDLYYNDVVINEILFNPRKEGVDFVEIRNRTDHSINLQHWTLGTHLISNDVLLLYPGQHLALTTDPTKLYNQYKQQENQHIYTMNSLPTYPNQQGIVTISSPEGQVDSLYYSADMHQPFIKNVKGVSLERQSLDSPTNALQNFRSASTLSGGATPGYQNSVQQEIASKKNKVFLTAKTVSPNQDGHEDFLEINYEFTQPDYLINVFLFSENGRLINRLIQQQSAGYSGKITWDCRAENSRFVPSGIYLFLVEIYDEKGFTEVKKGGFVITGFPLIY